MRNSSVQLPSRSSALVSSTGYRRLAEQKFDKVLPIKIPPSRLLRNQELRLLEAASGHRRFRPAITKSDIWEFC